MIICAVRITRFGDTNVAQYTDILQCLHIERSGGLGTDYLGAPGNITVNPGDASELVTVNEPVCPGVYHGNESIIITLNSNYITLVPGLAASGTMTLVDNMDPPAVVLFSDPLTNAFDSTNWTLTFATTNAPVIVLPQYPNYTANNPDPAGPRRGYRAGLGR